MKCGKYLKLLQS